MKELRRGLKRAKGRGIDVVIKKAHVEVSGFVIGETKKTASGRASSRGPVSSSRGARRLADSFRPIKRATGAGIRSSLPDAWGQEIGSKKFRQFPAFVGFGSGMVGQKAVDDNVKEIGELYVEKVMGAFKSAYPDRV
jgi:hypothetical protein